jgi:hypothetical protein
MRWSNTEVDRERELVFYCQSSHPRYARLFSPNMVPLSKNQQFCTQLLPMQDPTALRILLATSLGRQSARRGPAMRFLSRFLAPVFLSRNQLDPCRLFLKPWNNPKHNCQSFIQKRSLCASLSQVLGAESTKPTRCKTRGSSGSDKRQTKLDWD